VSLALIRKVREGSQRMLLDRIEHTLKCVPMLDIIVGPLQRECRPMKEMQQHSVNTGIGSRRDLFRRIEKYKRSKL
jgi:hypothetical protein